MNTETSHVKAQLFEQFARLGKALASPKRIELLELLAQGERPIEALADATALSLANTSHHLGVLREARLVETRKEGTFVFCRLAGADVLALCRMLQRLAASRLAEVEQLVATYFKARDSLEPVQRDELERRLKKHEVVVLDVRPIEEFRSAHIPGALSIPIDELERRLRELPRRKEIVAYCRGPFCIFSHQAVALLRENGLKARRLQDGLPDWLAEGRPVESGT